MLLSSVFEPFLAKRPLCVMARGVLQHLLEPGHLDRLFVDTAERGYQRELLFSTLTDLFSEVVLRVEPSVHAAYQRRDGDLGVSAAAVYKKLNGIEPVVSAAVVRDAAKRAQDLLVALKAAHPPWLPAIAVGSDGNHLSATEHRLGIANDGRPRCRVECWSSRSAMDVGHARV